MRKTNYLFLRKICQRKNSGNVKVFSTFSRKNYLSYRKGRRLQRRECTSTRIRTRGRGKSGEGSIGILDERTATANYRVAAGANRQ